MIYSKVCFIGGMPNGILFGLCTINDTCNSHKLPSEVTAWRLNHNGGKRLFPTEPKGCAHF